ncbi:dTDP-4-dehydrorhamnose reductase [Actimicrobium sp. GrIS 1.19]|uniref:pyridine nucleotide transhydrogenase n=1 Tax=Actimicrobium sp. GrIS 1.19 TaxID=3071708 RepID=UPI002DFDC588|nr:dTDP-4-dehydrorhamnose reductase [Actimicrobium sp. GrIS 1.19]
MADALIGFSGFIGSTLLKQTTFGSLYRSSTIDEIEGGTFDTVVCAGAPAQKWMANRDPAADRRNIDGLISRLKSMQCKTFVLISTVDVFTNPVAVNEDTPVDTSGLHAYGLHRRLLEQVVADHFADHLIVRLPGLVGPGLRKNVIFDFLNDNNIQAIDSRGTFQFYPTVNLWSDIQTARHAGLKLVHLTAAPISVAEVSRQGFGKPFEHALEGVAATYDMQTRYANIFGAPGNYQYSSRETIQAVRAYAQSEARTIKSAQGTNP